MPVSAGSASLEHTQFVLTLFPIIIRSRTHKMFSIHNSFEVLRDSVTRVPHAHSQGWKLGLERRGASTGAPLMLSELQNAQRAWLG